MISGVDLDKKRQQYKDNQLVSNKEGYNTA